MRFTIDPSAHHFETALLVGSDFYFTSSKQLSDLKECVRDMNNREVVEYVRENQDDYVFATKGATIGFSLKVEPWPWEELLPPHRWEDHPSLEAAEARAAEVAREFGLR